MHDVIIKDIVKRHLVVKTNDTVPSPVHAELQN